MLTVHYACPPGEVDPACLHAADPTWAFSSLAQRLTLQWKEAVNQSFFGHGDSDGASPAVLREHQSSLDHPAATHPPTLSHHGNATIHSGPFMEDALRALRRGLLVQMEVHHNKHMQSNLKGHGDVDGSVVRGGDFSIMLDMGYDLATRTSDDSRVHGDGAAVQAGSATGSGSSRPMMFVSHEPLVFACLRHSVNIPDSEYCDAFQV